MRWFYLVGFLLLATLDTLAHVAFKLTAMSAAPFETTFAWLARGLANPWLYLAAACYAGTFFVWLSLLRRAPIGAAFAVSHIDVVTVLVVSATFLNEHITRVQVLGALLITTGIAFVALDESHVSNPRKP